MKTQRYFVAIISLTVILSILTSCTGYNSIMRNHLCDKKNYHTYCGKLCDIYYFDDKNQKVSLLSNSFIPDCDVMFQLTFSDDIEALEKFLGAMPNTEISLSEYKFSFSVTKENNKILVDNGYDTVSKNSIIKIIASNFIYMDGQFFLIAAIRFNDTEYLNFEDGFNNIVDHINNNKSLI